MLSSGKLELQFLTSVKIHYFLFIFCGNIWILGCSARNIVSTVNLGCKLDLKMIALQARNAEYNPKVWGSSHFYSFYIY